MLSGQCGDGLGYYFICTGATCQDGSVSNQCSNKEQPADYSWCVDCVEYTLGCFSHKKVMWANTSWKLDCDFVNLWMSVAASQQP